MAADLFLESVLASKATQGVRHAEYEVYLGQAIQFLRKHHWLHKFKVVRFYVEEWSRAMESLSQSELRVMFDTLEVPERFQKAQDFPESLAELLDSVRRLSLPRTVYSAANDIYGDTRAVMELPEESERDEECKIPRNLLYGMTPKKQHEVARMAHFVGRLCRTNHLEWVVDLGAGMGYLDCVLCDVYNLNVIAVECDQIRTESAEKRVFRHTRKRPLPARLHHRTLKIQAGEDCRDELLLLIHDCGADSVCMVGLHCCGDLTPRFLDLFAAMDTARALVCVGCCYHLMEVRPDRAEFVSLPLSSCTKRAWRKNWTEDEMLLTVPSLRLATQETKSSWLDDLDRQVETHTFRGVLEYGAEINGYVVKKKRRHTSANHVDGTDSFEAFLEALPENYIVLGCSDIIGFSTILRQIYHQDGSLHRKLRAVRILQGLLQSVLESFIVIDRLVYTTVDLREPKAEIVALFDDSVSPRNLALVVLKEM